MDLRLVIRRAQPLIADAADKLVVDVQLQLLMSILEARQPNDCHAWHRASSARFASKRAGEDPYNQHDYKQHEAECDNFDDSHLAPLSSFTTEARRDTETKSGSLRALCGSVVSNQLSRLLLAGAGVDGIDLVFGAADGGFGVGSGVAAPVGSSDSCAADDCLALDLLPCAEDSPSALPAAGAGLAAAVGGRAAFAGFWVS